MKSLRVEILKRSALPLCFAKNLSMAALLILSASFVACSSNDDSFAEQPQQPATQTDEPKTYTITIKATKSSDEAMTRALSLNNHTLNATWTNGDKVNVYTMETVSASRTRGDDPVSGGTGGDEGGGTSQGGQTLTKYIHVGTLTASDVSDDGQSATLSGSLTLSGEKKMLYFYYGTASYNYGSQGGTLAYVNNNLDRARASISKSKYNIEGDKITTNEILDFKNQQAIVKFILQDQNGDAISVKNLSITTTGEYNTLDIAYDASTGVNTKGTRIDINATSQLSVFYVAMPAITMITGTLCLESNNKPDYYNYEKVPTTNPNYYVKFESGKYYEVTVKMKHTVNLSEITKDYEAKNYSVLTGTIPAGRHLSIVSGAQVTLSNVTISDASQAGITCKGSATITLVGENSVSSTIDGYPGIQIGGTGTTLTIEGDGKLTVSGNNSEDSSGIGCECGTSNNSITGGNIIINSGSIIASGGGAGIGSIHFSTCGTITINGGNIKATGGTGIGSKLSTCGDITINDGTIEAEGDVSPGIGCGTFSSVGTISIKGGSVKAKGGQGVPGIGSGSEEGSDSNCNGISISGGQVEASGGQYAAGIGSGLNGICGVISITGGTVNATGGINGAGIGCGDAGKCSGITINNGTIEATGNIHGAGIGSGYGQSSNCNNISITGGNVKAMGGDDAAGIGSGLNGICGVISITGGTVESIGSKSGAGIGSGGFSAKCGDINITGGTTEAQAGSEGAAGIGGGYYAYFKSISITNGISSVKAIKGNNFNNFTPVPIGKGGKDQSSGTVTVDNVANWAGASTTHLNFSVSTTTIENDTWTLTPKN